MKKTLAALNALTPEQKAVLQEKRLEGSYTPQAMLALLRPVSEFDRLSDKSRVGIGCWSAVFFVLAVVCLIVTANGVIPWLLGAPLILGLLGAFLFFLVTVIRLSKVDLSNNFRQIALPFVAILREDMEKGEPMQMKLDLTAPTAKTKKTGESDAYALGVYYKVVDHFYRDAWFEGSAWLADGSSVSWAIVEDITESMRTKRNARGKHKTKSKYRKICHLAVDVTLPHKEYSVGAAEPSIDAKVKVKPAEKRTTLRLTRKVKIKSNEPWDVRALIELVAEAFRRAKPAAPAGGAA